MPEQDNNKESMPTANLNNDYVNDTVGEVGGQEDYEGEAGGQQGFGNRNNSAFAAGYNLGNAALGLGNKKSKNGSKKDDKDKKNGNGTPDSKDKNSDNNQSNTPSEDNNQKPNEKSNTSPNASNNNNNKPNTGNKENASPNAKGNTPAKQNNSGKRTPPGKGGLNPKKGQGLKNNRFGGIASKLMKGGSGKGKEGDDNSSENRKPLIPLPLGGTLKTRVAIVGGGIVIIIVILFFIAIFVPMTAVVSTMSLCENTDLGEGGIYSGSGDVTEFMCGMTRPYKGTQVNSKYGWRICPFHGREIHSGVDIQVSMGEPVYAVQSGIVIRTDTSSGYGHDVVIDHGGGIFTRYAHNSKLLVGKDDRVRQGQQIAEAGSTGNSTGPHGHFEIMKTTASSIFSGYQDINAYFVHHSSFKANCGSSWGGNTENSNTEDDNTEEDYDESKEESSTDDSNEYTYTSNSNTAISEECCDITNSSSTSSNTEEYCPGGIVVTGRDAGTYDLDEYVERVVTCENGGAAPEALRALAIAARTYALNATDNCKDTIANDTTAQVMSTATCTKASDKVKKALQDVTGSVMLYNGKYFSAQYSSFYGSCSGDTCTSTLKKVPSNETATFTMPHSYLTTGVKAGHENGLSQNGSNYMATEQGKTYDEILDFFYADGIEITNSTSGNTCVLGKNSFNGKIWPYYQIDYPNDKYGTYGTIASHGCGTTAMAMVVSSFYNEEHDPKELTKYACDNKFCTDAGTSWAYFPAAAKNYGFESKTTTDKNEVLVALNRGDSLVIALMQGSDTFNYSSGGHFILLSGGDGSNVVVHDPASKEKSGKQYDFEEKIASNATRYWIFIAPESDQVDTGTSDIVQKIFTSAEKYANLLEKNNFKYGSGGGSYTKALNRTNRVANCSDYTTWILKDVGLLNNSNYVWINNRGVIKGSGIKGNKKFKIIMQNGEGRQYIKDVVASGKMKPGDIVGWWDDEWPHIMIYKGKKGSTYYFYWLGTTTHKSNGIFQASKIINHAASGTYKRKISAIIRPIG